MKTSKIKKFYNQHYKPDEDQNRYSGSTSYEIEGRAEIILSELEKIKPKTVLDVGCGKGYLSSLMAKKTFANVTATDLSDTAIKSNRRRFKNIKNLKFKMENGTRLSFENESFDIVISSEVIEHVPDKKKFLSELKRVVKEDGKIILTTPNTWNPNMVIKLLLIRLKLKKQRQTYDAPISPLRFRKIAKTCGLKIERMRGSFYMPLLVSEKSILFKALKRTSLFIEKNYLLPHFGLYQIYILRKQSMTL